MKICPQCNKTYDDETLNFCLDDGSVLNRSTHSVPAETVVMEAPDLTGARQSLGTQASPQAWDNLPPSQPASSGSRSWLWVLGILGAVVFLCGGGFVALLAVGSFIDDEDPPTVSDTSETQPIEEKVPKDSRITKETVDLSKWDIEENDYVSSKIEDGELVLTSKERYYYVILTKGIKTYDATVKLTLRNTTGGAAPLGYGLVIHSEPVYVLEKDYALLIRSDTRQYRIVRHSQKRERNIVNWTRTSAIKSGSAVNELEARVNGREMSFYINGVFIRTEKDFSTYQDGVAGIYTSGNLPIGFSEIEYKK